MSVVGPWRGLSFVGPEGGSFFIFFELLVFFIVYKSWPGGMIKDILYPK